MARGRSSSFYFHALAFGGPDRLAALLAAWRADGLSFQEITRRLETDHAVRVDPSTLSKGWLPLPEVQQAIAARAAETAAAS